MKRISLVAPILCLALWLGCGGDDDDGPTDPNGPTTVTVTAATGTVAPARLSVEDTVWTRIAPKTVSIASDRFSSAGKIRPASALAVAGSVAVQAVVVDDTLYLRLAWDDNTYDCWPGRYEVTSFDYPGSDTLAHFTQDELSFREDQAMVFFQNDGATSWDVWQWRLVTTGAGYLAEGYTLTGTALTRDAGAAVVATANDGDADQPAYMHLEGPGNESYRLEQSSAVAIVFDLAWQLGQYVPGWLINSTLYLPQYATTRASRWDIGAFSSSYSSLSGFHVVVLHRALNTGYPDDLDMIAYSTLNARVGITNNADFSMSMGDTKQGFTSTFVLNLP